MRVFVPVHTLILSAFGWSRKTPTKLQEAALGKPSSASNVLLPHYEQALVRMSRPIWGSFHQERIRAGRRYTCPSRRWQKHPLTSAQILRRTTRTYRGPGRAHVARRMRTGVRDRWAPGLTPVFMAASAGRRR
jgi:hypothetical protein